jgi:hypothetical protein
MPTIEQTRPGVTSRTTRWTAICAVALSAFALTGCSRGDTTSGDSEKLMLSGPTTDIIVAIPRGWHQVINSANPIVPQMVAPTTCMGNAELSCALGLTRLASLTAASAEAAAQAVEKSITSSPGVTMGATATQGPGKIGRRDGYIHRFEFSNASGKLTCEIAAVASGPSTPEANGDREYSVVLVWVSDTSGAPSPSVIDEIVGSAKVAGGTPAAG